MSLPATMVSDKAKCIHNNITELPEQLFILLLGYSRLASCTISCIYNPLGHSMVVIITPSPILLGMLMCLSSRYALEALWDAFDLFLWLTVKIKLVWKHQSWRCLLQMLKKLISIMASSKQPGTNKQHHTALTSTTQSVNYIIVW